MFALLYIYTHIKCSIKHADIYFQLASYDIKLSNKSQYKEYQGIKLQKIFILSVPQTLHEVSRWSTYPPVPKIKEHIRNRIEGNVNYVLIFSTKTLEELSDLVEEETVILVNVSYEEVDLTDNIIIKP